MVLIRRVFDPAIGLLDRLRYPWKFSLISLCFALPIILLINMLFLEIGERIAFAERERGGVAYAHALEDTRRALYRMALAAEAADGVLALSMATERLSAVEQHWGRLLDTGKQWTELNRLLDLRDRRLTPAERRHYVKESLAKLDRLNARVGNQSNLILDPDLDTYYLMDAVLLKLPEIAGIAADISLLSAGLGRENEAERGSRLTVLAGRLQILLDELDGNLEVAFTESSTPETGQRLRQALAALRKAGGDTLRSPETGSAQRPAAALLEQTLPLWDGAAAQLDRLLERRIDSFAQKRWHIALFVAAVLVVVAYLFIAFYLAVMRTVSCLDIAARKMAAGEAGSVTLENRDELGQVVHAFNRVAVALVGANREIQQLNDRLTADNLSMSAELDITRRLQQMILPRHEELRQIPELDIAGFMEPAFHVGGDYYDVLTHEGGILFGIGDVTGHGLESGVLMIMVQTAVRTLLASKETDPVKFFTALNSAIYDNVQRMDSDKNLSLALVGYKDGLLRVSGQHEEMIVVRADGGIERIDTIDLGFPIGLDKDIAAFIAEIKVSLAPGDGAVLYTDGITEAADRAGRLYGMERLCAVLSREWGRSAAEIREAVIGDVRRHIGGHTVYDDITLLVMVRRLPSPSS